MSRVLLLLILSLVLIQLGACKKNGTDNTNSASSEFSFSYNGQTYSSPNYGGVMLNSGSRMEGIVISKPDVFGGIIYFYTSGCAYLVPTGTTIQSNGNCLFTNSSGGPIDSAAVFLYRSGSISTSWSNCKLKRAPDLVFGGFIEYEECTVTGTFSLVIGNNAGQVKNITGSFRFPRITK